MRLRFFRRVNRWLPKEFDEWREVRDDGQVVVFFGTSKSWPPDVKKRSESKPGTFEAECAATLERGFIEVDEKGKRLVAQTEEALLRELDQLDLYVRFEKLRARLRTVDDPAATVARLQSTMKAIESDLDEHDSPFPGPNDVPPDHGAVLAYAAHFKRLAEKCAAGQPLSRADRDYEYSPGE